MKLHFQQFSVIQKNVCLWQSVYKVTWLQAVMCAIMKEQGIFGNVEGHTQAHVC